MSFWNKIFGKGKTDSSSKKEEEKDKKQAEQKMQYDHMDINEIKFPPEIWKELHKEELDELDKGEIEASDVKFNLEIIEESSQILNSFKLSLNEIDGNLNPVSIKREVNSLVESLNGLSKKYDNFINTGEREDLCLWINCQIEKSGYKLKEFEDLTLENREW